LARWVRREALARRSSDLGGDGNDRAWREDICIHARHRPQHLDQEGHLAVPRWLDAAVANRTHGTPRQARAASPVRRHSHTSWPGQGRSWRKQP